MFCVWVWVLILVHVHTHTHTHTHNIWTPTLLLLHLSKYNLILFPHLSFNTVINLISWDKLPASCLSLYVNRPPCIWMNFFGLDILFWHNTITPFSCPISCMLSSCIVCLKISHPYIICSDFSKQSRYVMCRELIK